MVGNKFLQDDGEDEEVMCSEWAESGGLDLGHLKKLELDFLYAMVSTSIYILSLHLSFVVNNIVDTLLRQAGSFCTVD